MDELARLRWQCRRGTKELDFLLNRYLETGYLVADRRERELFEALLKIEDDELFEILMGKIGGEERMEILVNKLRSVDLKLSL